MKQLYLLLSLLLLCTTVLRVDASIILSGPVLVPGIQLRSNLQPSDYFTAGSVAAGAASFMCPTNPAQNDSSGVASADTGAFYVNKNFSISQFNGGFQVIVNFNQSGPYGGISAPGFPGRGFAFVIHQSGNVVVPPDGQTAENLGFRNLTNVAGFGLKWPFSTGSPSFNWFPSYSVNEPAVSNQTNIASINETIRVLTIQYETYNVPTPMVSAFMDGNLLFHSEINLPNYIGNSSEAANFGIAGSIAQGFRHGQMFSSGPIPVSNSLMDIRLFSGLSRLSVSCPRLLNLFAKNVVVPSVGGRGSVSSGWVAEHYTSITSDWVPDDVVYFQGNDSIPNPYCVIELRNNSIPINIVGLMRCSDTLVTGMNLNSTDDSLITPAGVFGTNAYANFNGYPHVGGISSWAERVWAPSASSPSAYCRVRVPRYCVPTDLRYCWNSESCVNGLCNCVPPFGGVNCTGYVTPTISSASPLALTMNSGAWITVTGTNFFNTGTPSCFFTGTTTGNTYSMSSGVVVMNDTTLQCQLPNFSGSVSELFTLQVDNGFMGSTKSNGFNISVFVAPIPTAVYPSNSVVDKAVNLTIQGNFPLLANMAYSIRINSTVAAPCTRVNSTTLSCQYTSSSPGVYPVEVSGNGMQYYSINTTTFTWFVTNSPYCRNYQAGSSRPNEFPFVPSTDIQRGGNITFIKNVAYFANVNTSFSGNMSNYGLSLVDSDYCCQATGSNQATYCGSRFSITNTTAIIDVTFPKDARINEVITSWNNPCQNLVGAYNLHYRKSSTVPFTYIKTTTTNNATCVTVSGDNRPVGICVDYFSSSATSAGLIDTRYLRITFDVSTDNLPPTSTGAWLYEISVIGAFLDEAWAIKSSSAFWNSFAKFTSNDTITLSQSFGLSIVSINNSVASNANGLPVQIALFDSYGTDVSSKYLSVPGGTNQTFSGTIFNGVQLVNSTPIGNYSLRFTSTGLQSSQIPFAVTAGPPYRIRTNNSTLTVTADAMVPVTSVTICVEDKQGNVVFPDPSIEVLVSLSVLNNTLTFSGSTYLTVTGGCNSFPFNLSTPYAMTHLVMFTATYQNVSSSMPSVTLGGSNISLTVQVGSGSKMIFTGNNHLYDAPAEPDANDPPVVTITDGAGNALSGTSRGDLYNSYSATLTFSPTTARNLSGIVATFNNGVAKWPNLAFEGVPGTVYTVTATIDSGIFPPTNFPITVKNCSDIQQDTFLDGWSCKCKPGYTDVAGECTPCPAGTYSTGLGSTECTDCPPDQDTYGQTGQTTCVCDEDHMAAKGGECKDCPTGAICGNNTVQGNQEGYWNNGNGIFYPCYVGDESNPTDENLQSSYEACPSERSHNKTNCGEGYAGLACLECADGYGKQGDYCRACPNATINWAVIIFALLVILCMLVFLVIQGRTPKNKESVSGKILLNHIQMMSLLASLGAIWTDPFFTFLKIGGVSTFADTQLVSVDCTVGTSFYSEFIFFMLIPIFTVVISSIVYVIVYIIRAFIMPCIEEEEVKRSSVRTSVLSDWVLCIAVVTFIFYPAICIKALEIFDCNIDIDDKTYLTVAPGEECLTARWRGFVVWAVIMLAVFCVGVPLFVLFMLYKYRMHPNVHAQTILRFFYDGFKSDRYYWEVVILARKFLIVLFIIVFRFRPIYQIFGMLFVIQAALLIHIMFHPYTSGRQYKLELMSLLSILVTLFISLYLADKTDRTVLAAGLSAAVMCMHLFVVASFAFFIGRGLLRRMLAEGWLVIVQYWNRFAPKRFQKKEPQFDQVTEMFQQLGNATDYERDQLYAGLENWWNHAPNYKRRRFVSTLEGLSEGTQFARTLKGKKRDRNNNNNNNNNTPNDESDPASDNEPEANVEMQQLP